MSQPNRRLPRALRSLALVVAVLLTGVACAWAASAPTPEFDPLHTDGDKYHLVFENRLVRVLRYHDEPGATTHLHHHPCFVLYALVPFKRELSFPDGSHRVREFHAGEAAWMPAQSHAGHNTGATPTEALLFELKGPCGLDP
jgi:quercetin dioxygenase-like cupin family protein